MRWDQGLVGQSSSAKALEKMFIPMVGLYLASMVVFIRVQERVSEGAMILATLVDNSVSANHSWVIMAESPLKCHVINPHEVPCHQST